MAASCTECGFFMGLYLVRYSNASSVRRDEPLHDCINRIPMIMMYRASDTRVLHPKASFY